MRVKKRASAGLQGGLETVAVVTGENVATYCRRCTLHYDVKQRTPKMSKILHNIMQSNTPLVTSK